MGKQQRISSSRTTKDAERNLNASLKTEQLFTSKHSVAINRTSVSDRRAETYTGRVGYCETITKTSLLSVASSITPIVRRSRQTHTRPMLYALLCGRGQHNMAIRAQFSQTDRAMHSVSIYCCC